MTAASFREKVFDIVRRIPRGCVLTYGEVARRAGNSGAARAVGAILRTNYNPGIPCHRVIRSDGTPGGYNRGSAQKRKLLRQETRNKRFSCQIRENRVELGDSRGL